MRLTPFAALATAGLLACDKPTGVEPPDLAGTWSAQSFTFISVATPSLSVDLIALGGNATLAIEADGTAILTTNLMGSTDSDSGTLTVDGNVLTMEFDGDVSTGTISRNGNTLTITLTSGVEFDLNDDGSDDEATFRGVFQRQ